MKTEKQIKDEITALKKLKPFGIWAAKTARMIKYTIEELEMGWDQTADEFEEMNDSYKDAIRDACEWKEGRSSVRPSATFKGLAK